MREFDETSITAEALRRLETAPEPRSREIIGALVRHLHAFVREVAPTEAEWAQAIDFLTRTGQMCDATRQEFILLSDTLGVSTLVDAINNRFPPAATPSTVLGPFFVADAPRAALGADIDGGDGSGARLHVTAEIVDLAGAAIPGAVVDVWHADAEGFYDVQRDGGKRRARRGRFTADGAGRVHFWTTMPASYPVPHDGPVGEMLAATGRHAWRPAHVHFMIATPGYRRLVTHVFVAGDRYLESDAVFGVKEALIAEYRAMPPGRAPDGTRMAAPYRTLAYRFVLTPEDPAGGK